jgi:hypothetical protein
VLLCVVHTQQHVQYVRLQTIIIGAMWRHLPAEPRTATGLAGHPYGYCQSNSWWLARGAITEDIRKPAHGGDETAPCAFHLRIQVVSKINDEHVSSSLAGTIYHIFEDGPSESDEPTRMQAAGRKSTD